MHGRGRTQLQQASQGGHRGRLNQVHAGQAVQVQQGQVEVRAQTGGGCPGDSRQPRPPRAARQTGCCLPRQEWQLRLQMRCLLSALARGAVEGRGSHRYFGSSCLPSAEPKPSGATASTWADGLQAHLGSARCGARVPGACDAGAINAEHDVCLLGAPCRGSWRPARPASGARPAAAGEPTCWAGQQ